jgi:protein-disulfide isomerase
MLFSRSFLFFVSTLSVSVASAATTPAGSSVSAESESLFTIDGKNYRLVDLTPAEQMRIHELELNRFRAVESLARQRFVDDKTKAFVSLKSSEKPFAAEEKWLNQSFDPSTKEIEAALETFKDEKQLQALPAEERTKVMRRYLGQQKRIKALTEATDTALQKGEIKLALREPKAPVITFTKSAQVGLGDVNAPVRVVEFTDFQCPYCKKLAAVTQDILSKHGKKIHWEVRHFPLGFHKQARAAAAAVHCAAAQGKLAEAKKWVFDAQDKLAQENIYTDMSKALKLKAESIDKCRSSEATEKAIQADVSEGERVGVSGTPTVFVNGRKFEGDVQSVDAWEKVIQSALKSAQSSKTL